MKYIVAALAFGTTMLACGTDFGNSTGTVRVNKHGVDVNVDVPFDDAGDSVKWPDQDCFWTPTLVCCESGCVGVGDDSGDVADNSDRDSGSDNSDGSLGPSQDGEVGEIGEVNDSDTGALYGGDDSGSVSGDSDSGTSGDAGQEEVDSEVTDGSDTNDSGGSSGDSCDSGTHVSDSGSVPGTEDDAGIRCTVPVRAFKNRGACVSYCAHTYLKGSLREHNLFVECKSDCDCAYDN